MPYIDPDLRISLAPEWELGPDSPGELNFQITTVIKDYWKKTGNYKGINDILGALEGAKLEFYRRIAVPYEDKKIQENGDVY